MCDANLLRWRRVLLRQMLVRTALLRLVLLLGGCAAAAGAATSQPAADPGRESQSQPQSLSQSLSQSQSQLLPQAQPQSQSQSSLSRVQIAFLPDVHFHDVHGDVDAAEPLREAGSQAGTNTSLLSGAGARPKPAQTQPGQTQRGQSPPAQTRPGQTAPAQQFTGPTLLRTMAAQLQSTRLFNENYFALKAALDDLVRRQVKLVVLPGDFSDDGQPVHVAGLAALLKRYQLVHGMRFFLTFGNHDPVTPFGQPAGKADFLGAQGQPLAIYSEGTTACPAGRLPADSPQLLCRAAVRELGYAGLIGQMGAFGVMPQPADLYWETPFSRALAPYHFKDAKAQAALNLRQSEICQLPLVAASTTPASTTPASTTAATAPSATAPAAERPTTKPQHSDKQQPENQHADAQHLAQQSATAQPLCAQVPDTSYLVEPLPGLWLLALDANVYLPKAGGGFSGSGNAGYNALLAHKPYLIDWIADVVARAKAQQKTLISFSHFPMSAFYQGQELKLAQLLSDEPAAGNSGALPGKAQLARLPSADTSQTLAALGLTLHIGGHMHLNNTAFIPAPLAEPQVNCQTASQADCQVIGKNNGQKAGTGTQLVNVQAPSLAAYRPAYKLLTLENAREAQLQSIELRDVPGFDQQFGRYQQEWQQRAKAGLPLWDRAVLDAKNYGELTDWHLRELVRSRFLPKDWPAPLRALLQQLNGQQLLLLALSPDAVQVPAGQMPANKMLSSEIPLTALADTANLSAMLQPHWQSPAGQALAGRLAEQAEKAGLDWSALARWQGDALVLDLYRLQNAGALALADISPARLAQYRFMAAQLAAAQLAAAKSTSATQSTAAATTSGPKMSATADTLAAYSRQKLTLLLEIVTNMAAAPAYDDFRLDLTNGALLSSGKGENRQSTAG